PARRAPRAACAPSGPPRARYRAGTRDANLRERSDAGLIADAADGAQARTGGGADAGGPARRPSRRRARAQSVPGTTLKMRALRNAITAVSPAGGAKYQIASSTKPHSAQITLSTSAKRARSRPPRP